MDRVYSQSDVAVAIARSRAAREARARGRRRRNALLACAAILLGGGTAMSIFGFDPSDAVEAATNQAKSLAELIDQRSPGERTSAELTKLKKAHHAVAKVRPKVAMTPPVSPTALALAKLLLPPPEAVETIAPVALLGAGPPPTLGGIVSPPGGGIFPPPEGGFLPPPGGGTTTPPGGTTTPPGGTTTPPGDVTPPPGGDTHIPKDEPKDIIPVPPVPEPGTWATMLLGFALIGWQLRRQTNRMPKLLPA
jgi:hypothetical protein